MRFALTAAAVCACLMFAGCSSLQTQESGSWSGYTEVGEASFYANRHQSKKTASGERYDADKKTAAHRKLPFGSRLKVTNLKNGQSVVVRVNDRGPFAKGRLIDLSRSAYASIGSLSSGVIRVRVELLD